MSAPIPGGTYGPQELVEEVRALLADAPELQGEGAPEVTDLDHAPNVAPPAIVVGPPSWTHHATVGGPREYELTVYIVVAQDEDAFRELMRHTATVERVLDEPSGIAVKGARPTTFPGGSTDLPGYAIDIGVTA